MGRLPDIDETKLSAGQRRAHDEITRVHGRVRGPFAVWLRNPELAENALKLGVSPDIVEAIRERRAPNFTREDERLVYDTTMGLNATHTLSEASYTRGWRCPVRKSWSSSSPGSASTSWSR